MSEESSIAVARRLVAFVWPHKARLVVAFVAMVGLAVTTGLYPVLIDMLTTSLFGSAGGDVSNPWAERIGQLLVSVGISADVEAMRKRLSEEILVVFGFVVAIKGVSQAVRFHEMGILGQKVTHDLRRTVFGGLIRQDTSFFDRRSSGTLVSRVINDVTLVEATATYAIPVVVGDVLKIVVLAGMCVFQYGRLSLIALAVLPLAAFPIVRFGRMLKRYGRQSQEALGDITHRVGETLGGMSVVKTFVAEDFENGRFEHEADRYLGVMKKSVLVRALQTPVMEFIGVAALLVTMAWAQSEISAGRVRPGEVIAFLLALILLYEPLKAVGRISGVIMPGLAAAERIFEVIDRPPDIQDAPDAVDLEGFESEVRFEDVHFRYEGQDRHALAGVELTLPKGRTIALVGPSGSGKSTMARLLPRLYDVSSGAITIDGRDIRKLRSESLRRHIAVVAQENFLFDDSIRANIAYAQPDATEAEIIAAAEAANAMGFISGLPKGLDTPVGERGVQLSGGQRQRIAIARAFLEDAPILILDEATSALDSESEREVQKALDRLLANRTTLVIAHRLTTVRNADEIVVLDDGHIVERGTHDDLMRKAGAYAGLVRAAEEIRG